MRNNTGSFESEEREKWTIYIERKNILSAQIHINKSTILDAYFIWLLCVQCQASDSIQKILRNERENTQNTKCTCSINNSILYKTPKSCCSYVILVCSFSRQKMPNGDDNRGEWAPKQLQNKLHSNSSLNPVFLSFPSIHLWLSLFIGNIHTMYPKGPNNTL